MATLAREVRTTSTAATDDALLPVYRRAQPVFVRGSGSWLMDEDGREYLDFTSGIGVNALGHGDAGIARAMEAALAQGLIHTSNLFRTRSGQQLAEALVQASFADRVFFCNSGGEANEGALKFARRYARSRGGEAKHQIVALRGAFHGRLFGSLAATDREAFRAPFEPLMPGVVFVDPDPDAIRAAVSAERTAALIAEPVQGEGGIRPLADEVLRAMREAADVADAALIFDEVQCGLGRTGTLFAYEASGVMPDLLALAKPLAGGLPMGAVLVNDRIASSIRPGDHGTTFGGGPLVSAVALEVLARVSRPEFLADVRRKGDLLQAQLASRLGARAVAIRGRGLMWGVELEAPAAHVVLRALDRGLLVLTAGERVVRLLPPLNVSDAEIEGAVALLAGALA